LKGYNAKGLSLEEMAAKMTEAGQPMSAKAVKEWLARRGLRPARNKE
jgi:hypothetical protein